MTIVGCLLSVVIGNRKSHQAIRDERIANEDGELSHHIHIVLLTIGYQALSMVRTSVVFERSITQSQLFSSSVRGKTTNQTTEENEHNCAAKHFVVHKSNSWSSSDSYDCEGSSCMSIGQTKHQPHTVAVLSHRPSHNCGGKEL